MYASYRNHKGEFKTQNFDNPMSPFGGNGLPLGLLHGHRRPGSPWSIGEAGMLKQDQDRLNLLITLYHRILRKYSWQRVVVDR
ncbi:hypothetical protein LRR18_18200, partial [Mangrovimonas sp. AS39]|uniref:hypothetical protein n=1 Tax=Mangrovimonas futianensis TaxID=2895523 RepID=UPI001E3612FC